MDPVVLASWPDGAAGDIWRLIPVIMIITIIIAFLRMATEWLPA